MTANEIFDNVLALCYSEESDKESYTSFKGMLNIILAETFEMNNVRRNILGKELLTEIPIVKELTDEIDYEPMILRTAVTYGVAGMLYAEDDDTGMGEYYRNKYHAEKENCAYAEFEDVRVTI